MMAFRPKHLSVSSVALYVRCPLQFRHRYVNRLVTPTTVPQAWGTAFHSALEAHHNGDDIERAWVRSWNAMNDAITPAGLTLTPGKAVGLELLKQYVDRGLGAARGDAERKFVLPFPTSKIPVPLLGYIDLALPNDREYRDYKTSGSAYWNAVRVQLEPQVAVYGWAYQRLYRHRAEVARWVIFRTDSVTVEEYTALPSPEMFRVFEQQAELVWQAIVAGQYDGCGTCETCKPPTPKAPNGPTVEWDEEAAS